MEKKLLNLFGVGKPEVGIVERTGAKRKGSGKRQEILVTLTFGGIQTHSRLPTAQFGPTKELPDTWGVRAPGVHRRNEGHVRRRGR